MQKIRLFFGVALILVASYVAAVWGISTSVPAAAQALATDTPIGAPNSAYITNTFEEAINVRPGPSTTTYSVPCGLLPVGAIAVALGTTPAHEWVQIQFPDCPGGVGWVYAANVTLTGALHVVESPPTPTPLATATLDPTLVAAFQVEPTVTRLPTFTPPPPLALPTFADGASARVGFPAGAAILVMAALGGLVLAISFVSRR